MDLLAHYNYAIQYRLGDKNGAADALSRRAELVPEDLEEDHPNIMFPVEKFVETTTQIAKLNDQEYIECIVAVVTEAVKL